MFKKFFLVSLVTFVCIKSAEADWCSSTDSDLELDDDKENCVYYSKRLNVLLKDFRSLEGNALEDDFIAKTALDLFSIIQKESESGRVLPYNPTILANEILSKCLGKKTAVFNQTPERMKTGSELVRLIKEGSPIKDLLEHPLTVPLRQTYNVSNFCSINWDHIQQRHYFSDEEELKKRQLHSTVILRNKKNNVLNAIIVDRESRTNATDTKTIFPLGVAERYLFKLVESLYKASLEKSSPNVFSYANTTLIEVPECGYFIELLKHGAVVSSVYPVFDVLNFTSEEPAQVLDLGIVDADSCSEFKLVIDKKDLIECLTTSFDQETKETVFNATHLKYYREGELVVDISPFIDKIVQRQESRTIPIKKGLYARLLKHEMCESLQKAASKKFLVKNLFGRMSSMAPAPIFTPVVQWSRVSDGAAAADQQ